ncbi:MAG: aldehyde dehydrogenase family protein [Alphaproteobacteria bacterium]|nr:MAG: aldehyde dehydrogenase family protein [Alphaproteobacteria bacterium]
MTTIRCISPVDGRVYAEREALSLEAARGAVARLRQHQRAWAGRPLEERVALVRGAIDRLEAMNDRIVEELAWQMGRPVRYGGEIGGVRERADYMTAHAPRALAPEVVEDSPAFLRKVTREPQGVVLVIAPWNYPYLTALNTIVPALVAGNAVMLKHASQTLLVGERIAEAFHDAGVPEDVFANVVLDHPTTSALIGEKGFDFINFTGSVRGGAEIERAAAGTFTGLGLELGGKDPGYVMEDADLDAAVATLMDGALYNSGQCCCGIERIYVAAPLYDAFVEKAVEEAKKLRLGNPLDPETTLGPMANLRFAEVVRAQVAEAIGSGARALVDPALFPADDGKGPYVAPQILVDVDHSMRVMREETFGPVVGIMKVESDAEAIRLMNDSDYGLTASLWTADPARAERVGREVETGTVFMNRCDYVDPGLCWTGCKMTGRGGAMGTHGFLSVTRPKSWHLRKAVK